MKSKVLICEAATGIVLAADAKTRHQGDDLPYLYFSSLAEATEFASSLAMNDRSLEICTWDEQGTYVATVCYK